MTQSTTSIQQIQQGVSRYVNEELAKKKTGPSKFLIHFLEGLLAPQITSYLISLQSNPLLSQSMFDENGNVYLDNLATAAKTAFDKSGGKITAMGFVFDKSDVDTLMSYITQ